MNAWISVKNRLPDDNMKGRTILTYVRHRFGGMTLGMVRWFGSEKTKRWQDVTHWMPIPEPPEGEEGGGRTVDREVQLMDRKKPLKDWTLNELKEYCDERPCRECIFCDVERKMCRLTGVTPSNWVLTAMPRWTVDDIEDAKAIKRLYPNTVKVERCKDGDEIIKFICGSHYYVGHSGLLPSLAVWECVDLQKILDAEEDLNEK